MQSDRIRLCGLWRNTSKGGADYLGGNLGGARLLIFKNERKSDDRSPDYTVYLVPKEREGAGGEGEAPRRDDIPF